MVGRVSETRAGGEETLQGTGLTREPPPLCGNNHLESWLPQGLVVSPPLCCPHDAQVRKLG